MKRRPYQFLVQVGSQTTTDIVYFGSNSDKNCNLDGNITIAGLMIQPGYDGTISFNDRTITITGDFIKKDGTLNAGTSKVILAGTGGSGNQKVEFNPSQTLYNIEITNTTGGTVIFNTGFTSNEFKINPGNYLKFGAGETFAINTLTGSGTSENPVYLISTSFYDVWNLNLTNSATLSYLAVASCNASAGAYLAAGNSTDLGGNSNCVIHKVEITSVLNRYHAEGSAGDATIEYKITGTDGFVADQVVLTITRDGEENPFYTKTEPGNKPIGSYSIIWPANADAGGPGINDQVAEKSPFIATVEIYKECKGISKDPGDAANEKIYIVKVEQSPAKLWWFNGENPANYAIEVTLTAKGATTGTFKWDVAAGILWVDFENDSNTITKTNNNTVIVKSTNKSATENDVTINFSYNGSYVCSHKLTVYAPDKLDWEYSYHADWSDGYISEIHYQMKDQFDQVLPNVVGVNEHFTAEPTSDWPGEDWGWAPESGYDADPSDTWDTIGRRFQTTPTCQNPQIPLGSDKIDHRPGTWGAGTTTAGGGVTVKWLTWQIYRDHGAHE